MFRYISIFFLLCNISIAQDYFIHLTESGIKNKSHLLSNQLENISNLDKVSFFKSSQAKFREIAPAINEIEPFEKWLVLQSKSDTKEIIENLSQINLIDFYEAVGQFKIDFESDDSLAAEQWYLDKINIKDAWTITKGSSDIIISIIDTGIDFVHPDLQQAMWINALEDLNGNGILDEEDINNIDDDQNGYVDDVIGWDFTDAPRFVDSGDYLDEDNEPWDDFGSGHGTQAAGIIAAKDNNSIGIAGIAPGIRIMNLRAGTAGGYLEEDDVGRAILYAMHNGAHIINMSFGDIALSRFLRDVITYAADHGVIFIASSGNSNSSEPHYPSSLPQVISVGASTKNDGIAGFSNYGNSLDLVAPGSEIVSTAIGGKYNTVGGTSFSAPVVSGVAGLVLSNNSSISADQMRNILKTSSDDVYYQGWDTLSAAGRVSAYNALRVPAAGILKITSPETNSSVADNQIVVIGSAAHPDLVSTELTIGVGEFPSTWILEETVQGTQLFNDTLATFQPTAGDTIYTVRIIMNLLNSRFDELRHSFNSDKTSPVISKVKTIDLWDGSMQSKLITFDTDDICTTNLFIRTANSDESFKIAVSSYETKNHRFKLNKNQYDGDFEFFVQAKNGSGLLNTDDNIGELYSFSMNKEITWAQFSKVPWTLSSGYMLDKITDFDHDGNKEIVISRYDENSGFGPVEVYEFNNGQFDLKLLTGFTAIPRAAGDIDNDGNSDLLLGFGQNSFLFEAVEPDSFPSQLIWQDTVNFWAADYTDLDGDNLFEITGRIDKEYIVLENNGDNSFIETGRLSNPTDGENRLGVPRIELLDINNDEKDDIVFGDYDGDLIAYSSDNDNSFYPLADGKTIHLNASEILSSDSNGIVITSTHTSENLNYEHEFDARYWSIESFVLQEDRLISQDTINTFGFSDTRDFDSGLAYSIFDGKEYLFASFFPYLYIFEIKQNKWEPVWYYEQARSNTILVFDFDNDGNDEFYFNDGENIIGFSAILSERPAIPFGFSANPIDSVTISLKWQRITDVDRYNVYRGDDPENLQFYLSTINNFAQDSVQLNENYYYAVTSVDSSFQIVESFFSSLDSIQTLSPPKYTGYQFSGDRQILLHFDGALGIDEQNPVSVRRSSSQDYASSVVILNKSSLLISFANAFVTGLNDTLFIENVFGETGVPISLDFQIIPLVFDNVSSFPYVKSSSWYSKNEMMIVFSEPMDLNNGPLEFQVMPSGRTKSVTIADSFFSSIIVDFTSDTYIGATGEPSYLILDGLTSLTGVQLDGITRISLFIEIDDLKNIKVYPQPIKPKHNELIFANLPGDVEITIYNMNGRAVKYLSEETLYGGIGWDLKDDDGNNVSSGIYIYNLTWNNKSEQGKIVIVR